MVAPVPWFPSRWSGFGEYATLARTPEREQRHGIDVQHPRYLVIPKVGMRMQPSSLAVAGIRSARALRKEGFDFDVIDAHYFYPDGVAARIMSSVLGKPFVVTARGSDLNLIAESTFARRLIVDAAREAASVICVSSALRNRAIEIGMSADHVEVLRNGVDTSLFAPRDRRKSREALQLGASGGPVLLCVGNLVPEKGYDLAVRALMSLPGASLVMIGRGPERTRLQSLAMQLGVESRLRFIDEMPQSELALAYSAADVLLLTSMREGWPNVLLEAMACGTPVVAIDVGGVREIVSSPIAGRVLSERSPETLAVEIESLLVRPPSRDAVRRHAMEFGWRGVVERQLELLTTAAHGARERFVNTSTELH